jgi:hypothetical protein
MVTLIFGKSNMQTGTNNTSFPFGFNDGNSEFVSSDVFVCPYAGVFQNFRITHTSTLSSQTFGIFNSSTSTLKTINLSNSAGVVDSDDITTLTCSAGQTIGIYIPSHSGGQITWSFKFISDNDNESFIVGKSQNSMTTPSDGVKNYVYPACNNNSSLTESLRRFYCTTSGVINKFYILQSGIGNSGTRTYSIYKNGVEEASSIITTTNNSEVVLSSLGLSISFSIGDTLTVSQTVSGGGGGPWSTEITSSIAFSPTNNNEQMIGGVYESASNNNSGVSEYGYLHGNDITNGTFNATEANRQLEYLSDITIPFKNFTVNLESAPGSGNSRVFRSRLNTANGGSVVTISDTNVTGSDLTHIDNIATDDLVDISQTAS